MSSWKNQTMVEAGKKAAITRLKNSGQSEKALQMENSLAGAVSREIANENLKNMVLKQIDVAYDVDYKPLIKEEGLPWIEKYRPVSLVDLIGSVSCYLRAFVKTSSFPLAMVFFGEPGQGKTAGAKAFIRDYYVRQGAFKAEATFNDIQNGVNWTADYEGCWSPVLYIDSTNSSVDSVKDKVMSFMRVRSMWNSYGNKLKKFCVFDEANYLGYSTQGQLRTLMEKYPGTLTLYTTNKIEAVDPAIVSRASGGVFEFKKPSAEELEKYLRGVLKLERKRLSESTINEIAVGSVSVREAVGRLQQEVALKECQGD
jgi:replication factor C subunit 3/5